MKAVRDRVLAGWKVAKRGESKQRIKEALDKFIRHFFEVAESTSEPDFDVKPEQLSNTTELLFDTPMKETTNATTQPKVSWEDKAQNFLSGVKW